MKNIIIIMVLSLPIGYAFYKLYKFIKGEDLPCDCSQKSNCKSKKNCKK